MRKLSLTIVLLVLAPASAWAQFTLVTGTVVDPNGVPYAQGTITATLPTAGVTPLLNGSPFTTSGFSGLDKTGSFTMRLADNTVMVPNTLKWSFTVCSAYGTVLPAFGTGPQCFTPAPITISGASQSLSATLTALAPALTVPFSAGACPTCITGPGTTNSIPLFTSPTVLGNSPLSVNGAGQVQSSVGILVDGSLLSQNLGSNLHDIITSAYTGIYPGTSPNAFLCQRAEGTLASPTATIAGDTLCQFQGTGHNGTIYSATGQGGVQIIASQNWTPTALGTWLSWSATPLNSVILTPALILDQAGNVDIGNAAPSAAGAPSGSAYTQINGATGALSTPSLVETTTLSPTSAGTAGTAGQFAWDGTNFYVCTVTGGAGAATWKKLVLQAD